MGNLRQFGKQQPESGGWISSTLKQMNLSDYLFVLALATKPLYLRSSGSVQLSDILFVLVFCLQLFNKPAITQTERENKWISAFLICVIYQFCINAFWTFRIQDQLLEDSYALLKSTLFYAFNFIVCITIFQLRSLRGYSYALKLYLIGTVLSIVIALVGLLTKSNSKIRATGTFNNPNQLGYFAIISLTAIVFFAKDINPTIRMVLVVFCICMSTVSMSKASIVASAILLFAYFLNSRDRVGVAKVFSIFAAILAVAVLIYTLMYADWEFLSTKPFILSLRKRMGAITTENDSDLGLGRGYERVREIGFWNICGVGEGAYNRFEILKGKEVHSLFASFIVSYGYIGLLLLAWITFTPIFTNKRYLRGLLCFSGVMAYCVTHNGVRSTLLWALLAMLMIRPESNLQAYEKGSEDRANGARASGQELHLEFSNEEQRTRQQR